VARALGYSYDASAQPGWTRHPLTQRPLGTADQAPLPDHGPATAPPEPAPDPDPAGRSRTGTRIGGAGLAGLQVWVAGCCSTTAGVLCTTQPEPDRLALLTAAGVLLCWADCFWAGYWPDRPTYGWAQLNRRLTGRTSGTTPTGSSSTDRRGRCRIVAAPAAGDAVVAGALTRDGADLALLFTDRTTLAADLRVGSVH
jgi:hypothetical protein